MAMAEWWRRVETVIVPRRLGRGQSLGYPGGNTGRIPGFYLYSLSIAVTALRSRKGSGKGEKEKALTSQGF
jgi:hypothetical protein